MKYSKVEMMQSSLTAVCTVLFDSSRCRLLEWDQAQWRTEVIVSLRRMIYQWQCRSLHVSLTPPPLLLPHPSLLLPPPQELSGGQAGSGSSLLLLASVSWTYRGITGLNIKRGGVRSFCAVCADVQMCMCCRLRVLHTRGRETSWLTEFARQGTWSRLVVDFMLSLLMLWILFVL